MTFQAVVSEKTAVSAAKTAQIKRKLTLYLKAWGEDDCGMVDSPLLQTRISAFQQLGYGLFLHYGLYSLVGRGEWYRRWHGIPQEEYANLAERFDAAGFNARAIVRMAQISGMKYIVMTTRHHDGFSLYDTRGLNTWDAPHSAAKRDLIAELAAACQAAGMPLFFYHTTLDWWHEAFNRPGGWDEYQEYLRKSVDILCTHYGPVAGFWFDGNWDKPDRDWQEDALYALIRGKHPNAILINNSSVHAKGAVRHPELDVATFEQGRPGVLNSPDRLRAAEMCETLQIHWGHAAGDYGWKSPAEIIRTLCACRRFGANLLLNCGPRGDGSIGDYETALLRIVGQWIREEGPCIYDARPSGLETKGEDFILEAKGEDGRRRLYYFAHDLPIVNYGSYLAKGGGAVTVRGTVPPIASARCLNTGENVSFVQGEGLLAFDVPPNEYGRQAVVRVIEAVVTERFKSSDD